MPLNCLLIFSKINNIKQTLFNSPKAAIETQINILLCFNASIHYLTHSANNAFHVLIIYDKTYFCGEFRKYT